MPVGPESVVQVGPHLFFYIIYSRYLVLHMPLQDWDRYLFDSVRRDMLDEFKLTVESICKALKCDKEAVLNLRNKNCKKTPKGATAIMVSCMVCNKLDVPKYIEQNGAALDMKDDDGNDLMDYVYKNKKIEKRLEEYFGEKYLRTNETLGGYTAGGRQSYLKL